MNEDLDYLRVYYGIPARRGDRVEVDGRGGVITRLTHYVWIQLDGETFDRTYHPMDPAIRYLESQEGTAHA